MRFSPTTDQVALREAVRDLLTDLCPPALVRSAWSLSTVDGPWAALAEQGLFGAMVPATDGGLGLDETDLLPLLDEVGYAAVPWPVAETAMVAVPLLAAAGDPTGQLPNILAGTIRIALANDAAIVPYGHRADLALVLGDDRARLVSIPVGAPITSTVDGSRSAIRLDRSSRFDRSSRLDLSSGDTVTEDPELIARSRDRAALGSAAQLLGLGRRMLDLTVGYVSDRRQFGRPVGSFQAVQHQLADAARGLEFAGPAVLAAGWALAHHAATGSRDTSAAVVLAVEAAQAMARTAIQCHGAIGYTVEYDLHLYVKRTWALAAGCDLDFHLDRLAAALNLTGAAR
jgi:alkylation response protein AidB-like acyl-CoA dehydrogenase